MSSTLIVLTQDDRRTQIKTTPSMTLKDVLAQACTHFKLSPIEYYELRQFNARPNKPSLAPALDLSLAIRLSNLPSGSKLSVVRTARPYNPAGPIKVALQLDTGDRIFETYSGATRLWDILLNTERQNPQLNLTRRQGHPKDKSNSILGQLSAKFGDDEYMIPTLMVANREFSSLNDLRNTTLASIGSRSSSILIRLIFKYSGLTLAQVLPQLEAPLPPLIEDNATKMADTVSVPEIQPSSTALVTDSSVPVPSTSLELTRPVDASSKITNIPVSSDKTVPDPPTEPAGEHAAEDEPPTISRNPVLYLPPSDSSLTKIHVPDSFFVLTPAELKSILASQQRRRQQLENTPLKTAAMREREDRQRQSKFPKTLVRVKCPDEYLIQLTFFTEEKVSELYTAITRLISPTILPTPTFRLVTTVPQVRDLDPNDDFWTAQLAPASVVRLISSDWTHKTPDIFDKELVGPVVDLPNKQTGEQVPESEEMLEINDHELDVGGYSPVKSNMPAISADAKPSHGKVPKWFRPFK